MSKIVGTLKSIRWHIFSWHSIWKHPPPLLVFCLNPWLALCRMHTFRPLVFSPFPLSAVSWPATVVKLHTAPCSVITEAWCGCCCCCSTADQRRSKKLVPHTNLYIRAGDKHQPWPVSTVLIHCVTSHRTRKVWVAFLFCCLLTVLIVFRMGIDSHWVTPRPAVCTSLLFTVGMLNSSPPHPRWRVAGLCSPLQRAEEHCVRQSGPELNSTHCQECLPALAQSGFGFPSQPPDRGVVQGHRPRYTGHLLCPQCARLQSRTDGLRDGPRQCNFGEL